jgi:hypothetical protein
MEMIVVGLMMVGLFAVLLVIVGLVAVWLVAVLFVVWLFVVWLVSVWLVFAVLPCCCILLRKMATAQRIRMTGRRIFREVRVDRVVLIGSTCG